MVARLVRLGGRVAARIGNEVTTPAFVRQAARQRLPDEGVAVFFATGPENFYQFEQWRRPLEALASRQGVFVIVDRPDLGRLVRRASSLPVVLARGSAALERLVNQQAIRVVCYLNQVEPNFRMLRFAAPIHVQLGHGESDKGGSVSHQHSAYDLTFVAGRAGRDRLVRSLRNFGPDQTRLVGRPQLDHSYPGAPAWPRESSRRVLYAPTWEGDRPSIRYGSLASQGVAIITALRRDPSVQIIYRPHPRTGQASAQHAAADRRIRALLATDGDRHLVDTADYGWQWAFADACVTDISAVAYDWLATGKPLVITEPEPTADRPASPLLEALPPLPRSSADEVLTALFEADADLGRRRAALTRYYFGDTAPGASTARFEAAIAGVRRSAGAPATPTS